MKKIGMALFLLLGLLAWKTFEKPKVYDCFLFFNEFDVLEVRLEELYDKVEKFILVEATRGFSTVPKKLYFAENKERFAKYLDKIVHVVVDEFPPLGPVGKEDYWEIENYQRDQIIKGLLQCRPKNKDIIIITDLDEIIRNENIDKIVKMIHKKDHDVVFGDFTPYRFFFNRKENSTWSIAVATSWKNLSHYLSGCQALRNLSGFTKGHPVNGFEVLEAVKKTHPRKKWSFGRIRNMGWHFTSIGGHAQFMHKIANYSHLGANSAENRDFEKVKDGVRQLTFCKVDDRFPRYIIQNEQLLKERHLLDSEETSFH